VADNTTKIILDLDNKKFLTGMKQAQNAQKETGDTGKRAFGGITDKLKSMAVAAAAAWLSIKTIQETIEGMKAGEKLESLNQQFDLLAERSGIAGDKMKAALKDASDGLVSTDALLATANKSMVTFGASAARMPELMRLARNASVVAGTDTETAFTRLADAIQQGSSDTLKQFGLIVDTNKAYKDYADSIGVATTELSKQAQATAILNASLDAGKTAYDGVDLSITETTDSLLRAKKALEDFKAVAGIVINNKVGHWFREVADGISLLADKKISKEMLKQAAAAGDLGAQIKLLRLEMSDLDDRNKDLAKSPLGAGSIKRNKQEIHQIQMSIDLLARKKAAQDKIRNAEEADEKNKAARRAAELAGAVDLEKKRKNDFMISAQLLALRKGTNQAILENSLSTLKFEEELANRKWLLEQEMAVRIEQLENDAAFSAKNRAGEKAIAIANIRETYEQQITALVDSENEKRNALLDRQVKHQKNAWDAFFAGMSKQSKQSTNELIRYSELGTMAAASLSGGLVTAFESAGQAGWVFGEQMKKAVLGTLADIAAKEGAYHLIKGLWPPNPVELAVGAGLLALSGVIRSAASSGVGSGGGGAVTPAPALDTGSNVAFSPGPEISSEVEQEELKRKYVTIHIEGNYFDTAETRSALVELIREEADATDFKIQSVGGGL